MTNVFSQAVRNSYGLMCIVIQSDLQDYNTSTSNAAIAQNIFFQIALSQFMSHRMKCLIIATASLSLYVLHLLSFSLFGPYSA